MAPHVPNRRDPGELAAEALALSRDGHPNQLAGRADECCTLRTRMRRRSSETCTMDTQLHCEGWEKTAAAASFDGQVVQAGA